MKLGISQAGVVFCTELLCSKFWIADFLKIAIGLLAWELEELIFVFIYEKINKGLTVYKG